MYLITDNGDTQQFLEGGSGIVDRQAVCQQSPVPLGREKLLVMKFDFFEVFEKAKEVEIQAVGSAGQLSAEVERASPTVDLSKAFGS